MQRIQFSVSRGVTHHATMEIPLGRIEAVVKKMIGRYDLNLSKDQKYKRKLKGVSVADMVVFFDKIEQKYYLFILVTAGETLESFTQQGFDTLNPIESSRMIFPNNYELVRTTRKKSAMQNRGRSHNDPETWTWRMNRAYYETIQVYLNKAVIVHAKNPRALAQAVHSLEHMIGLRGIRQQIGYLWAHTLKKWKHTYNAEMPYTLTLGFMRAVKDDAHSLAELMALHTVKDV
jgi:hypothetical protein